VHPKSGKQRLSRRSARRSGYTWVEAERPTRPESNATAFHSYHSTSSDHDRLSDAAQSLPDRHETVSLPVPAAGSSADGLAPSQPLRSRARFRREVGPPAVLM